MNNKPFDLDLFDPLCYSVQLKHEFALQWSEWATALTSKQKYKVFKEAINGIFKNIKMIIILTKLLNELLR